MKKIMALLLSIVALCAVGTVNAEEPCGKTIYRITYENKVVNGWVDGRSVNKGDISIWTQKNASGGQYSYAISLLTGGTVGEKASKATTNGMFSNIDVDTTALQFYIDPWNINDDFKFGLSCWGLDTRQENSSYIGGFSAIGIQLNPYLDYSKSGWQLVTIPLADLRDNGTFDPMYDSQMTEFDWGRIAGIYFTATNTNDSEKALRLARLDDVRLIRYLNEPNDVKVTETADGGYVSWKLPYNAEGTVLYKNGAEVKRFASEVTAASVEPGEYELQSYGDGMYSVKIPVTVGSLSENAPAKNGSSTVSSVKMLSDGGKDIIFWDDGAEDKTYYVFRNGKLVAKTADKYVMLTPDTESAKSKVNISGIASAGSEVILLIDDNSGKLPYFEQVTADGDGQYAFAVITDLDLSAAAVTVNVDGETADVKNDNGITYKVKSMTEYSVAVGNEDGISETVTAESAGTGIKLEDCKYENAKGEVTTDFYELARIENLIVKIQNNGKARSASLLTAAYTADGDLTKMAVKRIYLTPGEAEYRIKSEVIPSAHDGGTVKVFLWEDTVAMEPLCDTLTKYNNPQAVSSYTLSVNEEDYQKISGWGFSPQFDMTFDSLGINTSEADEWTEAYEALFYDLGATTSRFFLDAMLLDEDGKEMNYLYTDEELVDINEISKAVAENRINWKKADVAVNNIARSVKYGISDYMISMGTPPRAMLEHKIFTYGSWTSNPVYFLREDCVDLYCDVIVKELDYITKTKGLPAPLALSLQNEPENGAYVPRYEAAIYKKMAVALRESLDLNGYEAIKLIGPECSSYPGTATAAGNGAKDIFGKVDEEYANALDAIAVHSYEVTYSQSEFDNAVWQYANTPEVLKGKDKWQTEYCVGTAAEPGATFEMNVAQKAFQTLSADVGWAGNSRWYYWLGYYHCYVAMQDRVSEISWAPDSNGEVKNNSMTLGHGYGIEFYKNKVYDMLQMIYTNVPVGSTVKRVTLSENCTDIVNECKHLTDVIAFENGDSSVVAMMNNTDKDMAFEYSGLKGTTAEIYGILNYVDSVSNMGGREVADGKISLVIPKDSIVLVKTK